MNLNVGIYNLTYGNKWRLSVNMMTSWTFYEVHIHNIHGHVMS